MRKKPDTPDTFADLQFPRQGVDLLRAFDMQQLGSTPVGVNVRTFEALTQRGRGGSRPGIAKYLTAQLPNGAHLIQHLGVIVDPTTDALLDDTDPADPTDPLYMDDPSTNNLRERNPGRKVRIGGRGYGMSKNKRKKTKIKFVQSAGVDPFSTASDITVPFGSPVTAGNLIVAFGYLLDTGSAAAVTDNAGNSYSSAVSISKNFGGVNPSLLQIAWATVTSTGACTVSLANAAGIYGGLIVHEYSGAAASPLDGTSSNSEETAYPGTFHTLSVPVAASGSLVVGAFAFPSGILDADMVAGSGFTIRENRGLEFATEDKLNVSADTDATGTGTSAPHAGSHYFAVGASFKKA